MRDNLVAKWYTLGALLIQAYDNASLLTNASLVISTPLLVRIIVKKDLAVDGCTYYGHVEWQMVLRKWCVI